MKKQSRKSTTVTDIASGRSKRRASSIVDAGSSPRADAVVVTLPRQALSEPSLSRRMEASAGSPELVNSRKDRAAEYLADMGLGDREIAAIRESVPVVPFDAELIGRCRAFVTANLHGWDHATWLAFVEELATDGYAIGADSGRWWLAQKFVGSILEAIRNAELAAITAYDVSSIPEAKAA